MAIRILITGGTIDKDYDKIQGQLVLTRSHIDQMIEQARCKLDIVVDSHMLKDSLYMDANDRTGILKKCQGLKEEIIVITHGTDTMVETATVLAENIQEKTIVLFGAMVPFSFGDSDALFNFGTALAAAQTLPYGVYLTMNGIVFPYDKVKKNKEEGHFESRE
ncbi:asparaginase [bacterium]|nr:asparaginase [bacterium]